jgi:hypothetical protein
VGTAAIVPVPVRVSDCGEFVAVSVTVTMSEKVPTDSGVKVMVKLQLALAASVEPQVVPVWVKSVLLPVSCTLESVAEAVPVLVTMTVCGALVWPTVVFGKVSEVAETLIYADVPPLVTGALFDPHPEMQRNRDARAERRQRLRSIGDL